MKIGLCCIKFLLLWFFIVGYLLKLSFQGAKTLSDAGRNLLSAKQFKQLLSVCRFSFIKIVLGQSHVFQSAHTTHW